MAYRVYELFRRLGRRVAVALRIVPPVRLRVVGARGGLIHVRTEVARFTVAEREERTVVLPRGSRVDVVAEPLRRYRLVAIVVDSVQIPESTYSFNIMSDTTVTALFTERCWRVQVVWQIVSRQPREKSPRVSAELRIYMYTVAADEKEAEEAIGDVEQLYEDLQNPEKVEPPENAVTSFSEASVYGRAWIERDPPYGVEVVEVDCDEVEELDTIFAYMATYRHGRIRTSYKWRREVNKWRYLGRGE